ncbi:MAG: fused MFS/spermidine synthase [bacterium]
MIKSKPLLIATILVTGSAIMMVELLGARIISPYFGVSLYVWTSLITVTLVALACGYWWGGHMADKKGEAGFLFMLISMAGLFLLFLPFLKRPILLFFSHLGLRLGSLASSLSLFFIPLFLLGAVTPYLVKLCASDLGHIGQTVGHLYALSTIGSFLGTLLTGFLFIPHFRTETILLFISLPLVILSLIYWLSQPKRKLRLAWLIMLLIIAGTFILLKRFTRPQIDQVINQSFFHLTAEENSPYGEIKVIDINQRFRAMATDGLVQNVIDRTTGLSINEYTYALQLIARSYHPEGRSALIIGLGAGIIPSELRRDQLEIDCVEINPAVARVAEEYFGFSPQGLNLFIQDARYFVENCRKKYDLIFLDAFSGDGVPEHLLTLEMFQGLSRLLNPGGVLCMNFFGSLAEEHSFGVCSLAKTLRQVFTQVVSFALMPPDLIGGNVYLLATDTHRDIDRLMAPNPGRCFYPAYGELCNLWERKVEINTDSGLILRDNYNPIAFFDSGTREVTRKRMHETLGNLLL